MATTRQTSGVGERLRPTSGAAIGSLETLDPQEAAHWARRLERTAHPCGCKSGMAMSIAALVGWPAWILVSGPPQSPVAAIGAVVGYFLAVVVAGFLGKVVGIVVERRRNRDVRRRLAQRLAVVAALQVG